jgi:tetratricopeptide (TPR) repeat protein
VLRKGVRAIEMRLLQPANDADRVGALIELGTLCANQGQERDGLRAAREAFEMASQAADPEAVGRALALATRCHFQRRDYLATVASGIDALTSFGDRDPAERSGVLAVLARALLAVEDYDHALSAAANAVRLAAGDAAAEAAAREAYGTVIADRGRGYDAREELRRAGALYRRLDDRAGLKRIAAEVGHTYRQQANAAQGAGKAQQARLQWRHAARVYRTGLAFEQVAALDAAIHAGLAECELWMGDLDGAYEHSGRAVALAEEAAAPSTIGRARLVESRALQAMGRLQAAERACAHAVTAAENARDEPLLMECLRTHARLLDQLGRFQGGADAEGRARRIQVQRKAMLERLRVELLPLLRRAPGEGDAIVPLNSHA